MVLILIPYQMIGYWMMTPPANYQPQDELAAFLARGDAPWDLSVGAAFHGEKTKRGADRAELRRRDLRGRDRAAVAALAYA